MPGLTGDLTYLVTAHGKPYSVTGFGNKFREWCNQAGLPHCCAHGLRKAGAALAAENGATDNQLMAIFGWSTIQEAQRYTKAARRKKMAGDATRLLRRGKSLNRVSHSCERVSVPPVLRIDFIEVTETGGGPYGS